MAIQFTPEFGWEGTVHFVHFGCVYDPMSVTTGFPDVYGIRHHLTPLLPWVFDCSATLVEYSISKCVEIVENSRTDITGWNIVFTEDGEEISVATHSNKDVYAGNDTHIEMSMYGNVEETYRVSAYINNNLVDVFDGNAYIDMAVTEGQMSVAQIHIRKDMLTEDYNSFYIIAVPIGVERSVEQQMVEKSYPITIINK